MCTRQREFYSPGGEKEEQSVKKRGERDTEERDTI